MQKPAPKAPIKEIKVLADILNINQDAKNFYAEASKKVIDAHLKTTFQKFYQLHSEIGSSLKAELVALGASRNQLIAEETMTGRASQFFGELLVNLSNDPDIQLISRLEAAEDRCLQTIENAMIDENISSGSRRLLQILQKKIQVGHEQMKFWRQRTTA